MCAAPYVLYLDAFDGLNTAVVRGCENQVIKKVNGSSLSETRSQQDGHYEENALFM